jgi:hypothetical protein
MDLLNIHPHDLSTTLHSTPTRIEIHGLKGIDLFSWPHIGFTEELVIMRSYLRFYLKGKPISEYACDMKTIGNSEFFSFFFVFAVIQDVKYDPEPLCPYVFANTNYQADIRLSLLGQVDSIVYRNLLRFTDYNVSESSIGAGISHLIIGGYNYKLDTGLLHPLAFEQIIQAIFYNTINSIQTDLFKYFQSFQSIQFFLDSLGNFYHRIGIGWIFGVNQQAEVAIKDKNSSFGVNIYKYPDTDF